MGDTSPEAWSVADPHFSENKTIQNHINVLRSWYILTNTYTDTRSHLYVSLEHMTWVKSLQWEAVYRRVHIWEWDCSVGNTWIPLSTYQLVYSLQYLSCIYTYIIYVFIFVFSYQNWGRLTTYDVRYHKVLYGTIIIGSLGFLSESLTCPTILHEGLFIVPCCGSLITLISLSHHRQQLSQATDAGEASWFGIQEVRPLDSHSGCYRCRVIHHQALLWFV